MLESIQELNFSSSILTNSQFWPQTDNGSPASWQILWQSGRYGCCWNIFDSNLTTHSGMRDVKKLTYIQFLWAFVFILNFQTEIHILNWLYCIYHRFYPNLGLNGSRIYQHKWFSLLDEFLTIPLFILTQFWYPKSRIFIYVGK